MCTQLDRAEEDSPVIARKRADSVDGGGDDSGLGIGECDDEVGDGAVLSLKGLPLIRNFSRRFSVCGRF